MSMQTNTYLLYDAQQNLVAYAMAGARDENANGQCMIMPCPPQLVSPYSELMQVLGKLPVRKEFLYRLAREGTKIFMDKTNYLLLKENQRIQLMPDEKDVGIWSTKATQ